MPVVNLVGIARIVGKLIVIGVLAGIIFSFFGSFINILTNIFHNVDGISSSVNGLNLGWFADAIGLVSFLNTLMSSFYVAISVLASGTVTILSFKHGIRYYSMLLNL